MNEVVVTVDGANGLEIRVREFADGRYGFDWKGPKGREKIRLKLLEDAVRRAKEFLTEGKGGSLNLLSVSRERFAAFLRWEAQQRAPAMIPDLVADFISSKERKGRTWATISDIRSTLDRFALDFKKPIAELTKKEVEAWLDKGIRHAPGPRRRNNMLTAIVGLHRFARKNDLLPAELTPVEKIERHSVRYAIETYTPEEMERLLRAVDEEWRPVFVLGGFCGLRPEEVCPDTRGAHRKRGIQWEHILWDKSKVDVPAEVSKVRRRRFAVLTEAAREFLTPWQREKGFVAPGPLFRGKRLQWAAAAEVTLKKNGLRHSYASYRLALTKDVPALALEMGNSPRMIFNHYLEMVHEDEAEKWFGIRP